MVGIVTGISATALIAGAAVVGAGTAIYSAAEQGKTSSEALGLAKTTQGEQMYYNSLLEQLLADPGSVSKLPGFQFELDTGSKAVAAGMGAGGFAGSGNEAAALTQFGQGLAGQFYQQQTNLLASLSGVTSASSPAQAYGAATNAQGQQTSTLSSLLNSLGFFAKMAGSPNAGAPAGTPAAANGGNVNANAEAGLGGWT